MDSPAAQHSNQGIYACLEEENGVGPSWLYRLYPNHHHHHITVTTTSLPMPTTTTSTTTTSDVNHDDGDNDRDYHTAMLV